MPFRGISGMIFKLGLHFSLLLFGSFNVWNTAHCENAAQTLGVLELSSCQHASSQGQLGETGQHHKLKLRLARNGH